ncbi:hypothetical protein ACIQV0_04635 [Lysinibacillus capsici]|uniref:Uncharacterized protein n=1 Tax=Lysinibacillus capsici TaxID=2115968 RepID=A0ABY8KJ41_9BACI|nr:hypothetical protein [Lysinibacillus capsici]MDP1428184.1 hypothetical protein [Lysinibacillus capsici]MEC1303418.1 hypothetical protein [Lysinibacillus capsici]MED4551320.1 hypothetical protein [Lysinibacillus capsici]WGF39492.1 hypothetical protein QBO96_04285 [Lysinibacillus capsici]WNN74425.1 hypothetical protein RKS58_13570 [Lysinibacillus capsici]
MQTLQLELVDAFKVNLVNVVYRNLGGRNYVTGQTTVTVTKDG